ncbi:YycH family regulatory protein [Enterococcus sp. AZ192]|uniref:YycH family regulatory protein n=1 Tax=unclassified Enterococcus TaxID=2608891 RepID=UPI003D2BEDE8
MKTTERIIRIGLIFLVLLSLYFSFSIWLSSAKKEQPIKNDQQLATAVVNERLDTDVFLPLRLIRMQNGVSEMNNSENLITNIQNEIRQATFGKLTQVVKDDASQFENYLTMDQGFELLYEGPFLLSEYMSVYDLSIDLEDITDSDDIHFTCIQVNLKQNKLRFLNFSSNDIYETPISMDNEKVLNLMNKVGVQYNPISEQQSLSQKHYYLSDDLKMKKYSYILASQPVTKFRNAFFTNTEDIQTNEDSQDLSYASRNERLIADEKLGTIHFSGDIENRTAQDNIFSDSFFYIKKLGTSMGNLRYFDRTKSEINYRTFVEGFPVFSENDKGQVHITIGNDKAEKSSVVIETSVDTIQVPIPSEEEVQLQSTESLLEQLTLNGADPEKIDSMVIGYTWHKIEEVTQVVDLTPEWYIRYDGQWSSVPELLEHLANAEVE